MRRATYMVRDKKTKAYEPMAEFIARRGLRYNTVLARIQRSGRDFKVLHQLFIVFEQDDPIFTPVRS